MSFSGNTLVNVEGLVVDEILTRLDNNLLMTKACDTSQSSYNAAASVGTQGPGYLIKKHTRMNVADTLSFNPLTTGGYSQQYMAVAANKEARANYQIPNIESATFTPASIKGSMAEDQVSYMAEKIETDTAINLAYAGYRFYGNPLVPAGQFSNVKDWIKMGAQFRSFGGTGLASCFTSLANSADVKSNALNLFTLDQNDKFMKGSTVATLSTVPNIKFMETAIIHTHTSGTAADDPLNVTGYTIVSITPTPPKPPIVATDTPNGTTAIALSGLTDGTTFVKGDAIQINAGAGLSPLRFLNYNNYSINSLNPVQGRVLEDVTVSGGIATIQIEPSLIYDGTTVEPDVNRNLNREIVPGTDTLQVAKSHIAAPVFFKNYVKYIAPPLGDMEPFASHEAQTPAGVRVRGYYGSIFGGATKQFVSDCYYGYGNASEGIMRVLVPIDSDEVSAINTNPVTVSKVTKSKKS